MLSLARALQTKVDVLCLDEPFNSLDRPLGRELLELLRRELECSGTSAILVTHRLEEAQAFAQRLAILQRGEILQVGDPRELVLHPASWAVAELMGYQAGSAPALKRSPYIPTGCTRSAPARTRRSRLGWSASSPRGPGWSWSSRRRGAGADGSTVARTGRPWSVS